MTPPGPLSPDAVAAIVAIGVALAAGFFAGALTATAVLYRPCRRRPERLFP